MEACDLTGKTVIPFATSGGSGVEGGGLPDGLQLGGGRLGLCVQSLALGFGGGAGGLVGGAEGRGLGQHLVAAPDGGLIGQDVPQGSGRRVLFGQLEGGEGLPQGGVLLFHSAGGLGGGGAQLVLHGAAAGGAEDLPQHGAAPFARGVEQLGELALGDHGDLAELLAVHAQQLPDGRVHLPHLFHRRAARREEEGGGRLGHLPLAPLFGPLVLGGAADGVLFAPVQEGQFHKGLPVGLGVVAAHGVKAAHPAGKLAEQGIADGVKQGGLARPGVAGDEEQPAGAQLVQFQRLLPGVGAEGRKAQMQRSHPSASSPSTSSRKAFSSSSSSLPWTLW